MKNPTSTNIGNRIKLIREGKRLKQLDVAIQLGIEQSTYAKIENDQIKVSVERLIEIAEIFRTPISLFFTDQVNNLSAPTHVENMDVVTKLFENQNILITKQLEFLTKVITFIDLKK